MDGDRYDNDKESRPPQDGKLLDLVSRETAEISAHSQLLQFVQT